MLRLDGPSFVEEWEREWKLKFGGQEQDEVEGEGEDGDDEDSDDEEDEEEELGKKRKRAKTSPTSKASTTVASDRQTKKSGSPVVGANDQVPEKRREEDLGKFYHRLPLCLLRQDYQTI